jgi:hypothetical protein
MELLVSIFEIKILEITSLFFITNFLHNTWYKEYPYAWLFLLLTVTSTFIHSEIFIETKDLQNNLILLERFIILSIIIYGGILFWKTNKLREVSFIPILTFFTVTYMYIGGYFQNKYSFDPNIYYANIAHSVIHILGSLGHHIIIYEYAKLQQFRNKLLDSLYLYFHI